jgi:hypothetical protein
LNIGTSITRRPLPEPKPRQDARMLIGQCMAVELFGILKFKKPFNLKRYVSNLKKLPEEPTDE